MSWSFSFKGDKEAVVDALHRWKPSLNNAAEADFAAKAQALAIELVSSQSVSPSAGTRAVMCVEANGSVYSGVHSFQGPKVSVDYQLVDTSVSGVPAGDLAAAVTARDEALAAAAQSEDAAQAKAGQAAAEAKANELAALVASLEAAKESAAPPPAAPPATSGT